ncbi:MAG: hypothetical protein ABR582_07360 [Gemmatimonadaceae bacterium]
MAEKSAVDIILEILNCYQQADHCLVNALTIDDHNQRMEAGLKCLTDRSVCLAKTGARIVPTKGEERDIERLKAAIH